MKKNILKVLSLCWILPLVSCNEGVWQSTDFGSISTNIDNSDEEILIFKSSASDQERTYDLQVIKSGVTVASKINCGNSVDFNLPVANGYSIVATSGEDIQAAFDSPYYKGESASFNIEKGINTTPIAVACSLANVKVTATFSSEVEEQYSDYTLTVTNTDNFEDANSTLVFSKADKTISNVGYFKVTGKLKWTLSLTKGGAVYNNVLEGTFDNVVAREHYNLEFNTETYVDNEGASYVKVVCDSQLTNEDHEMTLNFGDIPTIRGKQTTENATNYVNLNNPLDANATETIITVSTASAYNCSNIFITQNNVKSDILLNGVTIEGISHKILTNTDETRTEVEINISEYISNLTSGEHTLIIEARNANGLFVQPITIQK